MRFLISLSLLATLLVSGALQAAAVEGTRVTLAVNGMTWGVGCAGKVQAALSRLDGVTEVKVNFDTKEAVVTFDKTKTAPKTIVAGLAKGTNGRYTATVKKT